MMLARHARQASELGADAVRLTRTLASLDTSAQLADRVDFFAPNADKTFDESDRATARNSSVD